jgi:hypothetical protein
MGAGWRLVVVSLLAIVIGAPVASARDLDPSSIALAALARDPSGHHFTQAYSATYRLPVSGRPLWAGKFVDATTGALRIVYVDRDKALDPSGVDALARAELARLSAFDRKADPALKRERGLDHAGTLSLSLWLDADVSAAIDGVFARHPDVQRLGDRPVIADPALARQFRRELYSAKAAVYASATSSVSSVVRALGGAIGYASTSAPLVFVDLPNAALDALAARPEVSAMGAGGSGWNESMAYAGPTVRSDWAYSQGYRGAGVRVADVEYYNVPATGDLAGKVVATHNTQGGSAVYDTSGLDHPTWVAGAIASQSSTYRGTAPAAGIVSSSTGGQAAGLARDEDIIAATDWAISTGDADIVNTSLGQDTSTGREQARKYFDAVVWEGSRISVSAAGNHSTFGNWDIVSPGTGWNVITVGGTDDRNSASWSDDVFWSTSTDGSCYADPTGTSWNAHGDFNKPNVSAPAVTVRTANAQSASGTSVATPITAGVVAELVGRSGTFVSWPEIPRALLMAGAIHHTAMPGGGVDRGHEGVGTVDAEWSNRILDGSQYGGYAYGVLAATGSTSTFTVAKGQSVRVALVWDSHTSGSNLSKTDTLTADLDLSVDFPGGTTRRSATFDNNYEVIEYTATASGTATIHVGATRFDAASEDYALAWVRWPTVTEDTQPPTAPGSLAASPTSSSSIALSWTQSTDDIGVKDYRVSRDGTEVAVVTGTSWTDTGLSAATTYGYSVVAEDAAGNVSPPATATATTLAPDTDPPSTPAGLSATVMKSGVTKLAWTASSDTVGVAGYRVFRNGSLYATTTATAYSVRKQRGTFTYYVVAFDAAGNESGPSNSVTVTV